MGCNPDVCRSYNLGTASPLEWFGHATWVLDLRDAMPKYGVYFSVPCLSMLLTFFSDGLPAVREYRGEIHWNGYKQRQARLYRVTGVPDGPHPKAPDLESRLWDKSYNPEENGSQPFDDLYHQHAITMANDGNDKGVR